jgi:hypothetical protein
MIDDAYAKGIIQPGEVVQRGQLDQILGDKLADVSS